jgi:hypothetical protein
MNNFHKAGKGLTKYSLISVFAIFCIFDCGGDKSNTEANRILLQAAANTRYNVKNAKATVRKIKNNIGIVSHFQQDHSGQFSERVDLWTFNQGKWQPVLDYDLINSKEVYFANFNGDSYTDAYIVGGCCDTTKIVILLGSENDILKTSQILEFSGTYTLDIKGPCEQSRIHYEPFGGAPDAGRPATFRFDCGGNHFIRGNADHPETEAKTNESSVMTELAIVNEPDGMRFRESPSVTGTKIGYAPYKSVITILQKDGPNATIHGITAKWYKIEFQGKVGWMFSAFLKPASAATSSAARSVNDNGTGDKASTCQAHMQRLRSWSKDQWNSSPVSAQFKYDDSGREDPKTLRICQNMCTSYMQDLHWSMGQLIKCQEDCDSCF